jgi:predicted Zn-dependent peptidase
VARPRWLLGIKETVLGGDPEAVVQRELSTRILMDILFGRSSAAFQSMYADGLIDESFGASHTAEPTFGFTTVGSDTDDPERLGTRVAEVFAAARSGGLDQDAWHRIRKKLLGSLLRGLDSVENTAFALMSDTFRGVDPFRALELLERISLADLQQRLEEHVRDDAMATAVVLPRPGP